MVALTPSCGCLEGCSGAFDTNLEASQHVGPISGCHLSLMDQVKEDGT